MEGVAMDSIDLIRTHLEHSRERVLERIEDMRDHALVAPTPRGGGHTLWVLGHLAFIESQIVRQFMLGEANPLAAWESTFDGVDVSADARDFPPFQDVLDRCRATRASTLALVGTLKEADLDRPAAVELRGFEAIFGTWRLCLLFAGSHWYMHRGQLADARRAAGLERMWV
jgi:hypothetical protein